MPNRSWQANLAALLDCSSVLHWLKALAWYASGVVLPAVWFYAAAILAGREVLPLAGAIGFCLLLAFLTGAALGWRASRARLCRLGAVVALYLPAIYGVLWAAAFCQDVWRGDGLPGRSLSVMSRFPGHSPVMMAMLCLAIALVAGGLMARSGCKKLQGCRTALSPSTTGAPR